jgi:TonB family protein
VPAFEKKEPIVPAIAFAKKEPIVYTDRMAYAAEIRTMIRRHLILPRNLPDSASALVELALSDAGAVADLRTIKSSGFPAYDAAIERAIHRAQPYPLLVVPDRPGPMPMQLRFQVKE